MEEIITKSFTIKKLVPKQRYLHLTLVDDEGQEARGIVRDNIDLVLNTFKDGDKILCRAKFRKTKNPYYDIGTIRRVENPLDTDLPEMIQEQPIPEIPETVQKEKFCPSSSEPKAKDWREGYIKKFEQFIEEVKDVDYHSLLVSIFNDDLKQLFFEWPGSQSKHHAYQGGLLEHTIQVVEIALDLSHYFKDEINKDLLITGCLLHDIGKLKSYEKDYTTVGYHKTDWEQLLHHLPMSALFISKTIPNDFDSKKAMLIYHLILSHHGKIEWKSPVVTKTKESFLLSKADEISYWINHIEGLDVSSNSCWTVYDDLHNNEWFLDTK